MNEIIFRCFLGFLGVMMTGFACLLIPLGINIVRIAIMGDL